uniref:polysaccharide lyase family 7 protein n=1 Tax=Flavobacterium sp. TaxID=239 RepID=UPI00404AA84A
MKIEKLKSYSLLFLYGIVFLGCSDSHTTKPTGEINNPIQDDVIENHSPYANIDFSNWKITLPVDENNNGSPDEYQPSHLINFGYQTLVPVMPFMYDDTSDKSIVFHTYPAVSTANSNYSRTELRELINPSNSRINWTLETGGEMEGVLKIVSVTEDNQSNNYDFHRVIVMQIHGIISESDMAIHGFSSNNGPPLLKMYWIDGRIKAYKKSLVNENTEGDALLNVSNTVWRDINRDLGYVGYEPFRLKIKATTGRLEVSLNNESPVVFEDVSMQKWPFENYFKAGNYLNTTSPGASATIKYYELSVNH